MGILGEPQLSPVYFTSYSTEGRDTGWSSLVSVIHGSWPAFDLEPSEFWVSEERNEVCRQEA